MKTYEVQCHRCVQKYMQQSSFQPFCCGACASSQISAREIKDEEEKEAKKPFISFATTDRGFVRGMFTDRYGVECSIQQSSLATESAIWLGVHSPEVKLMARDAALLGREDLLKPADDPERLNGWVNFPLPEPVNIFTRMHLTQPMVRELLPVLLRFARTGELTEK